MIAGAFYSAYLGDSIRFLPDEQDYLTLADGLANGRGFTLDGVTPSAFRPPVYPALLALLIFLGTGVPSLRMVSFLAFCLTLFVLGSFVQDRSKGANEPGNWGLVVVTVLGVGYPVLFFTAGTLYPQMIAGLFFVCLLALSHRIEENLQTNSPPSHIFANYIAFGLFAGLLVLTVPTFSLIALLIFAWQFFISGSKRRVFLAAILSLLVMVSVIGLWTLRNVYALGDFVLVSTNLGDNLIRGNAPGATSNSGPGTDVEDYIAQVEGLSEVDRDRYLQSVVFQVWKANPVESLRLYFGKVLNYFNYRNDLVSEGEISGFRDFIMGLTYYIILFLAVWRVAAWRIYPLKNVEKLAAGLYLFNPFYSAIVFTRIRYRLPFDYLIIFLAASLIKEALQNKVRSAQSTPDFNK